LPELLTLEHIKRRGRVVAGQHQLSGDTGVSVEIVPVQSEDADRGANETSRPTAASAAKKFRLGSKERQPLIATWAAPGRPGSRFPRDRLPACHPGDSLINFASRVER
jgi:hypothetical protein